MPSSRSAKEICAQYGDASMDCRVAKSMEADKPPPPEQTPVPPSPKFNTPPTNSNKREAYLQDQIKKAGG